jgi:hypothetical protein
VVIWGMEIELSVDQARGTTKKEVCDVCDMLQR